MTLYSRLRPLLFSLPPHTAHELGMAMLSLPEHVSPVREWLHQTTHKHDPRLVVKTMGLTFPNPLGIAAGFDKDGRRSRGLVALGFGHVELGTVTAMPQRANPYPNLFRLPQDEALINRLGFPNRGAAWLAQQLTKARPPVPVGISIGKSRAVPIENPEAVIADYLKSFAVVAPVADFVVVNVSSPNTPALRTMQKADSARSLLGALIDARAMISPSLPLLLKIAPDLDQESLDALLDVLIDLNLEGVVAANTTLSREGLQTPSAVLTAVGAGGLSGRPLRNRTISTVQRVRRALGDHKTVIGVGGIFTADDVRAVRDAGANLCQMYTGFIYQGPMVAATICRDLLRLRVTRKVETSR